MDDVISRQQALTEMWKALYDYEDKTEKQFMDHVDLDINDWITHRVFVQNMSDIDRMTILSLPSAWQEPDWSYDADTKEITLVVPEDIYNHAKTVFLSVGHEDSFGLRGKVYSAQPEIVFCKQCKYFEEADEDSGDAWCYAWGNTTAGDQFCSCGENIKDE